MQHFTIFCFQILVFHIFPFSLRQQNKSSLDSCTEVQAFLRAGILPQLIFAKNTCCMKVKSESEVAQSCPTLCDPMDCSLPGSSLHGILQARVLEWVAISFSRGSSLNQGSNPGLPHSRQML